MRRRTPAVPLALLLLIAAAREAGAIQLRYRFVRGEVATYRTMVAAAGQNRSTFSETPMRMQMTADVLSTQRVLNVGADGTAQVESKDVSGTMRSTAFGRTQTTRAPKETTIYTVSNRGRVLRYRELRPTRPRTPDEDPSRGEGKSSQSDPLKALFGLNFPARDLKPGDTWNDENKVETGGGKSVVVKIASRFVELTRFRGRRCAKITSSFEMPSPPEESPFPEEPGVSVSQDGKVTGQITTYFDVEEGREIYSDGSIIMLTKMRMSGGADPTGAPESAELSSVFKMNLRQVLVKTAAPKGIRRR
jgi:hypothetical protein